MGARCSWSAFRPSDGDFRLILHAGDGVGAEEMNRGIELAQTLALRCGSPNSTESLVLQVALFGLNWGVSDGI